MHWQYCLCPRSDGPLKLRRVHVAVIANVDEDGLRADQRYATRAGNKRIGYRDHFIFGSDPQDAHRQYQRIGPRIHGNGESHTAQFCKSSFELGNLFAQHKLAAVYDPRNGVQQLGFDRSVFAGNVDVGDPCPWHSHVRRLFRHCRLAFSRASRAFSS